MALAILLQAVAAACLIVQAAAAQQMSGLAMHQFVTRPLELQPDRKEVTWTGGKQAVKLPKPLMPSGGRYDKLLIVKDSPGCLLLRGNTNAAPVPIPPMVRAMLGSSGGQQRRYYTRLVIGRGQDCVDRKLIDYHKELARRAFKDTGSFEPSMTFSLLHQVKGPGERLGQLAEIVLQADASSEQLMVHFNFANVSKLDQADISIPGGSPNSLPPGAHNTSNTQLAGRWLFRIKGSSVDSAELDAAGNAALAEYGECDAATRRCKCRSGGVGDALSRCDQCEQGRGQCGDNARCLQRKGGNNCTCNYGYEEVEGESFRCRRLPTRLLLSGSHMQRIFVNQPNVTFGCKVTQGPTRPQMLAWSRSDSLEGLVSSQRGQRVSQRLVNSVLVLSISKVSKNDSQYFCLAKEPNSSLVSTALRPEVLEDPCPKCHSLAACNYSAAGCQCGFGLFGDGVSDCRPADCLQEPALCSASSELCLYNSSAAKYHCHCREGAYRVAGSGPCQMPDVKCRFDTDCHANATCGVLQGEAACVCRDGFVGDGETRCLARPVDCNGEAACASNAECRYDPVSVAFRCVCVAGFFGDGHSRCVRGRNCSRDCKGDFACPATTVRHVQLDASFRDINITDCQCPRRRQELYELAGGKALCAPAAMRNKTLLLAAANTILRVPADPSESRPPFRVLLPPSSSPGQRRDAVMAVAYNCRTKEVFWSELGRPGIFRASLDEAGVVRAGEGEVLIGDISDIEGLAVDWMTGNIYYTALYTSTDRLTRGTRFGEIGVVRRVGSSAYRRVLLRGPRDGLLRPRAVAVDPYLGKLYYADRSRDNSSISSVYTSGQSRTRLAQTPNLMPNGLVRRFDAEKAEEVCFVATNPSANHTSLKCLSRSTGSSSMQSKEILAERGSGQPYSLAYSGGIFFWTDWKRPGRVLLAHASGDTRLDLLAELGGGARGMGLAVAEASCPSTKMSESSNEEHICSLSRGYNDCKYLCLATPDSGAVCECPDDNKQCQRYANSTATV